MKYETTYLTVNGVYALPARTLQEAKTDAARLKAICKEPGHRAWGIKIKKLAK